MVVLPELFDTGFSPNIASVARAAPDTPTRLAHLARTYHVNLVAGYAEPVSGAEKINNTAAVYDRQGTLLAHYTKIHPFAFAQEDRYFLPGQQLVTCGIEGIAAGIFICYDLRFPEVFRCMARDVAAIFVLANWPTSRKEHWESLLKARAIENQCFIIGVNRIGADHKGLQFPGASGVFDPLGRQLCTGEATQELACAEIDATEVPRIRQQFPFLNDMRPISVQLS